MGKCHQVCQLTRSQITHLLDEHVEWPSVVDQYRQIVGGQLYGHIGIVCRPYRRSDRQRIGRTCHKKARNKIGRKFSVSCILERILCCVLLTMCDGLQQEYQQ